MDIRMLAAAAALAACASCTSATPRGVASVEAPAPRVSANGRQMLRGSECLDPAMARSWIDVGRDTLLVDAGRHKYRIEVSGACTALTWSPVLVFRGDPVGGRVCGNLGDAILTRDYPCTIVDMQLLDAAQYKALVRQYEDRHRKPVGR